MSSSPSRSAIAAAAPAGPAVPAREALPFPYPESPPAAALPRLRVEAPPPSDRPIQPVVDTADYELRARILGREEGQAESRKKFDEQITGERATLAAALAQFAQDRALYYQRVETEVVQLALSIVRHILHREAAIDPLLLAGMVRVALEKIEKATGVTLRIHPHNAADWRRFFAVHLDPADVPEIVEDAAVAPDRCILETSMGTAELGMEVQLKEIEKGLMDLLAARPEKTPEKNQ